MLFGKSVPFGRGHSKFLVERTPADFVQSLLRFRLGFQLQQTDQVCEMILHALTE